MSTLSTNNKIIKNPNFLLILGFIGCVLVMLGCFLPIIGSFGVLSSSQLSYFDNNAEAFSKIINGVAHGKIVFFFATLTLISFLSKQFKIAILFNLIVMSICSYDFYSIFTAFGLNSLGIAWLILYMGSILILYTSSVIKK